MTTVERVTDPADPRLRDYLSLTDVHLRRALEPAGGMFVAEGEKVIRRAVAAGYRMRSALLTERWLPGLREVLEAEGAPGYLVEDALAERVTGFHVHRGALACMARRPLPPPEAVLAAARRVVVLEKVNDHTNIGAIFRCAAALGMDAVLLTEDCADPLYRRAVKVSMGAVFAVPYARLPGVRGLYAVKEAGFRLLALTPRPDAVPLAEAADALDATARRALLLGAEGDGLSAGALRAADVLVRIPMAHGVDSLNVGAAAAVACYALA